MKEKKRTVTYLYMWLLLMFYYCRTELTSKNNCTYLLSTRILRTNFSRRENKNSLRVWHILIEIIDSFHSFSLIKSDYLQNESYFIHKNVFWEVMRHIVSWIMLSKIIMQLLFGASHVGPRKKWLEVFISNMRLFWL